MNSIRKLKGKGGEPPALLALDFLSLAFANALYYYIRVRSGFFQVITVPDFWGPIVALSLLTMVVYWFWGLYRYSHLHSRFDEVVTVTKASTFAAGVLFFTIFFDDVTNGHVAHFRLLIVIYWTLVVLFAGSGRVALRTFQRSLLIKGYGLHNALIIGAGKRAVEVYNMSIRYRALGYKPVGFVSMEDGSCVNLPVPIVGDVTHLMKAIQDSHSQEIIIALEENERDQLDRVFSVVNGQDVSLKIVPDLHDAISGQVKVGQLYGFPLIEIMPQLMQPWEEATKRTVDLLFSFLVLIIGLPLWLLVGLAIRMESKGTIIYRQHRVGQEGRNFMLYKFRSMYENAERHTGPTWADKNDPRTTHVGRILRKTHIDEVPQFFNVLKGDMSLIGPRPERQFFVDQFSQQIPLYKRRLKVKPGITGWAQIKHTYDQNVDDVKIKLQYDLFYIENMSLRMDFKIAINTLVHILSAKGHA